MPPSQMLEAEQLSRHVLWQSRERGLLYELVGRHTFGMGHPLETASLVEGEANGKNGARIWVYDNLHGMVPVPVVRVHELAFFFVQRFL